MMIDRLPGLGRHLGPHLLEADWTVVPAVYSTIEGLRIGIFSERPMTMTIKVPGPTMALVPDSHRIMTEREELMIDVALPKLMDFGKQRAEVLKSLLFFRLCCVGIWIVVAEDADDVLTVDPLSVLPSFRAETEVSEKPEPVISTNQTVDVVDQLRVHLFNTLVRASAVFDNVGVTEVEVTREEVFHGSPCGRTKPLQGIKPCLSRLELEVLSLHQRG